MLESPDDDDDAYLPDPDAAPTAEGRAAQAIVEMKRLVWASLQVSVAIAIAIVCVEWALGRAHHTSLGFVLGAGAATVNLWLLASGILQLSRDDGATTRGAVALVGSFTGLVVCAAWVVFFARTWTLGFALGLAVPALGGLWYARTLSR